MHRRRNISGMTLIELMVALAIGAFLMIGAITVFMQSRTTFRLNDSLARLQENGRFALDAIEPDIRMAHYFGLTIFPDKIAGRATTLEPNGIGPATCGNNWTIDFANSIAGTNNRYAWACAGRAPVETNADTLVVRRVTEDAVVPAAGRLHLQSARSDLSQLFVGAIIPADYIPATSQTFRVVANGYYVSRSSLADPVGGAPIPSLHRKSFNGTAIIDDEVLPGVEDMQIQFGVDTSQTESPTRGTVTRFVNPEDPLITPGNPAYVTWAQIIAVRVWLLIRSERPELGYTDTTTYTYGDRVYTPNDGFRRVLVTKTIFIRNARLP
jgi:type IV pilus assembly protein PilW